VIKATKITPRKIHFYTAASWKWKVFLKAVEKAVSKVLTMKELMEELLKDPELKNRAKETSKFASQIINEVNQMPLDRKEKIIQIKETNEAQIITEAKDFFEQELKVKIHVWKEEDRNKYDPKNRASLAKPYRPAIYME